ncbi:GLIPR1-like protein 1 [Echinococcus granulosus]|nr:GLIPR1-like protein 1 [Echinococcus granulosus]
MSFGILFGLFVKVFGLLTLISTASCQFPNEVEKAQLLETHHDARENVYPPASNMMLLLYSSHLEQLADYWASRCRFEHPDWSQYPHYHGLGQNIAAVGGFKPAFTEAVCGWRHEEKYYSYFNNSCTHICGHYTQMVWANTKWIGCAMRRCDGMRADWNNPQYFTVCQYKTAGNYHGEWPYKYGPSCSQCPKRHSCYRKQCVAYPTCKSVFPLMELADRKDKVIPKCVIAWK